MSTERYKLIFILVFLTLNNGLNANEEPQSQSQSHQQIKTKLDISEKGRALFSPRLEYNEWMPVGRGDPLKNDPTFDYSPPVLDRVRYWADVNAGKKDKTDILILGVASKKQPAKKDVKYGPIRRNFYSQQPSTIIMPPPMEQQSTGENAYHVAQNTWPQQAPAKQPQQLPQPIPPSSPPPPAQQYLGPIADNQSEGSAAFISIVRPGGSSIQQSYSIPQYTSGMNYIEHPPMMSYQNQPPSSMASQMMSTGIHVGSSTSVMNEQIRKPFLHSLLQTEAASPFTKAPHGQTTTDYSQNFYNPQTINSMVHLMYPTTDAQVAPIAYTTTLPPPSMTTDSLFSHYKQPAQPLHGPMYLIIEGHSKVKTYGRKDHMNPEKHPPKIVPISSTEDPVIRHVVNQDDSGSELRVQHLHTKKEKNIVIENKGPSSSMDSLLSLLDTSFGNFLIDEETQTDSPQSIDSHEKSIDRETRQARQRRNVDAEDERQETKVFASFQVSSSSSSNTKGQYRPGTVVNDDIRPLRIRHYRSN